MTPNTARPTALDLLPDGVPLELKQLPRWVGWRHTWKPHKTLGFLGEGKWVKVPHRVHGGRVGYGADSSGPDTWTTWDDALRAYSQRGQDMNAPCWLDGIGVVLGDELHGIDLDDSVTLGEPDERAAEVLARVDGYAEVSPSGTGLKMFTRTDLSTSHKKAGVELYTAGRYFAVTGHQINGHATLPASMQALGWLVDREFGPGAHQPGAVRPPLRLAGPGADPILLLQNLKAADPEWPLERVRDELLPHLSADVLNDEWVRVGQALHHQGDGADEWLELWDTWSQGTAERPVGAVTQYDPGACAERWATFGRRERGGADPRHVITIRSLIKETQSAREAAAGRAAGAVVATVKADGGMAETLRRWRAQVDGAVAIKDRDAADAELMRLGECYGLETGLHALLDARDLDAEGFVAHYTKALKTVKGLTRLPKAEALSILRGNGATLPAAPSGGGGGGLTPGGELLAVPSEWVLDAATDKFLHLSSGSSRTGYAMEFEFKRYMPVKADGTKDSAVDWLRARAEMQVVDNTAYHPMGSRVFQHKDKLVGNTFRPDSVPAARAPSSEDDWTAIRVVESHFAFLIPDARERGLLLSWIAWNVRRPGDKVTWMPFVQSVPGAGKSSVISLLSATLGEENVGKVSNEALHSEFTPWKTGVAVRALDEVKQRQGGQSAAWSLIEKLREPIVDATVTVLRKGQNEFEVPNVTNYIAFSNYRDALPLSKAEEERRLCMIFSPVTAAEVKARLASGEYARFHHALAAFGDVLRWWLASGAWLQGAFEMSPEFDAKGHAPMTEAKREVAAESQSDAAELVSECLQDPGLGISESVVSATHLRLRLVDRAKAYALHVPSPKAVGAILRELGWVPHPGMIRFRDKQVRAWTRAPKEAHVVTALLASTDASTAVLT